MNKLKIKKKRDSFYMLASLLKIGTGALNNSNNQFLLLVRFMGVRLKAAIITLQRSRGGNLIHQASKQ